ncbi:hypothetical protein OAO87_04820, partial [bacterium]|nr:hypothetical protein [bacterium]
MTTVLVACVYRCTHLRRLPRHGLMYSGCARSHAVRPATARWHRSAAACKSRSVDRGLRNANRTSAMFKKPLTFAAACARPSTNASAAPSAALCVAFTDEFLLADGSATKPAWLREGIDALGLLGRYFLDALPAAAAAALAARLGVGALPLPL